MNGLIDPSFETGASLIQQRFWSLNREFPGAPFYNHAFALRVRGCIDTDSIRGAMLELVERHEILRTRLIERSGKVLQCISPVSSDWLASESITGVPDCDIEAELENRTDQLASNLIPPDGWGLVKGYLIELGPDHRVILFISHPSAWDTHSKWTLERELTALLKSRALRVPSGLAPAVIQYADYANWEREHLRKKVHGKTLEYWRANLNSLASPNSYSDGAYSPGEWRMPLDVAAKERIEKIGRAHGASLTTVSLAAFAYALSSSLEVDCLVIGVLVANRNRPELRDAVGPYSNSVLVSYALTDKPSADMTLSRTARNFIDAIDRSQIPMSTILQELGHLDSSRQRPGFQYQLNYERQDAVSEESGPISVVPFEVDAGHSQFEICCCISDAEEFKLKFQFNRARFTDEDMSMLFNAMARFIEEA